MREAWASRFKGIPDVHYGDDTHWVSDYGHGGLSEWTLTGTTAAGVSIRVRGCDLWRFRDGKVIRKNSYWKIIEYSHQVIGRPITKALLTLNGVKLWTTDW